MRWLTLALIATTALAAPSQKGWSEGQAAAGAARVLAGPAADELPEKLLQQLAPGARMIIPVGRTGYQDLLQVTRKDDHFEEVSLGAVSFVPLVHGT